MEVRVTVVKCMFIALERWVPDMCRGLQDILILKQRDPSERVRALCAGIDGRSIQPESIIMIGKVRGTRATTIGRKKRRSVHSR